MKIILKTATTNSMRLPNGKVVDLGGTIAHRFENGETKVEQVPPQPRPPITETSLGTSTFGGREYEVFKLEGDTMLGYRLKGPRGADYSLLRNKNNPHMMFAMNTNNFLKKTAFEGRWFTDKDRQGYPCPLRLI